MIYARCEVILIIHLPKSVVFLQGNFLWEGKNKSCLAEQALAPGLYNSHLLDAEKSFRWTVSGVLASISLRRITLQDFHLAQNYTCCELFDVHVQPGLRWPPLVLGESTNFSVSNFVCHRGEFSHQGSAGICSQTLAPSRASFYLFN